MGAVADERIRSAGEIAGGADEVALVTSDDEGSGDSRGTRPDPAVGWPPVDFGEAPPVEPFPVDVFPARVADFTRAAAESIGCPADFVGLATLVVAGAAIGRSAALWLKPDYLASASLCGLNVGGPGSGKSPALDACVGPLWRIDNELHEAFRAASLAHERARGIASVARWYPRASAANRPTMQSAVLDDSTPEAVVRLLAVNPRGLLVARDDASAWVASLAQGQGGRVADRQFWLSALSGMPVRVDRKGDPDLEPVRIRHPFLSVLGNITPETLSALKGQRGRAGGVLERFLFAFPDRCPRSHWSDEGIPEGVPGAWAEIVGRLRARPMKVSEAGPYPEAVRFTPEAREAWAAWYNGHVDETNAPGFDAADLAADGKLVDLAGRMALVLHLMHLADDPTRDKLGPIPPVPRWVAEGAFRLWTYFRSHHRRVRLHVSGAIGDPVARSVADWVRRGRRDHFSVKQLCDDLRWLPRSPSDRDRALLWLEDRRAIRRRVQAEPPDGRCGRRPSPVYDVHPALWQHT